MSNDNMALLAAASYVDIKRMGGLLARKSSHTRAYWHAAFSPEEISQSYFKALNERMAYEERLLAA